MEAESGSWNPLPAFWRRLLLKAEQFNDADDNHGDETITNKLKN